MSIVWKSGRERAAAIIHNGCVILGSRVGESQVHIRGHKPNTLLIIREHLLKGVVLVSYSFSPQLVRSFGASMICHVVPCRAATQTFPTSIMHLDTVCMLGASLEANQLTFGLESHSKQSTHQLRRCDVSPVHQGLPIILTLAGKCTVISRYLAQITHCQSRRSCRPQRSPRDRSAALPSELLLSGRRFLPQ